MPHPPQPPSRAASPSPGKSDAAPPPRILRPAAKARMAVLAAVLLAILFGVWAVLAWVRPMPASHPEILAEIPTNGTVGARGNAGTASGANQPSDPAVNATPANTPGAEAHPASLPQAPTGLGLAGDAAHPSIAVPGATPMATPGPASPAPASPEAPPPGAGGESIDAALCRLIDTAAARHGLPASFFTRLIWRESSFRPHVVSRAGAQGIAQFMPGTAKERGLADPFDPEAAIPASAALLADLKGRFGNLGLAAAAYNAGPGRVSGFLAGGGLPQETRTYVRLITGRTAEDWAALKRQGATAPEAADAPCLVTLASLRQGGEAQQVGVSELFAPWGVQISGNYSKDLALASFRRAAARYQAVFGEAPPVIIATRMAGRGGRTFYRVRLPAQTRADANALCRRLRQAGGPCVVLPN